jgi:NADH-quinone oxidoreductase subunit A
VAILFIVFDVETIFLLPWAVSARSLGWGGFAGAMIFIFILTVGLVYEWKKGALEWD